jgi:[amino group carrier protein]-lysine/ornithine hydrolase
MIPATLAERTAVDLLLGLVSIPSLSREEGAATAWLVAQMHALGYDWAYVDAAGNAVGEMGPADAARTLVLLGHIDTVPGQIPVRIEESEAGPVLYGRGSVDAKGALAAFTAAIAYLGSQWAAAHNLRLVVVGAVEEEAATSKGARFIRDRFDGVDDPVPEACIIGEPSSWQRVTLGYKGRLLVTLEASQPMAHSAGPDPGVATVAVDFWNWLHAYATRFNASHEKSFDQILPSLRHLHTETDAQMHDRVTAQVGLRLPLDFDVDSFVHHLATWAAQRVETGLPSRLLPGSQDRDGGFPYQLDGTSLHLTGPLITVDLRFYAHEAAWRSDRNNSLVRSFLAAIREVSGSRPGFVFKTGTSDMNVVGPAWHCPILAYGPGDSNLDHTPNEHIFLDEYWQAVQVLAKAMESLAVLPATARQT